MFETNFSQKSDVTFWGQLDNRLIFEFALLGLFISGIVDINDETRVFIRYFANKTRYQTIAQFPRSKSVSHSSTPCFIGNLLQCGNWEGDLIIFERDLGEANVMTLVERNSRYCVIIKNNSRHSKPNMNKMIQTLAALPNNARRSFTFDRGSEFMGYRALEDGMGAASRFCDPNSPWQKGAIENINKRIRRYLSINIDLTQISQAQLTAIAHNFDTTPPKCLGFKALAEVFAPLLEEAA